MTDLMKHSIVPYSRFLEIQGRRRGGTGQTNRDQLPTIDVDAVLVAAVPSPDRAPDADRPDAPDRGPEPIAPMSSSAP